MKRIKFVFPLLAFIALLISMSCLITDIAKLLIDRSDPQTTNEAPLPLPSETSLTENLSTNTVLPGSTDLPEPTATTTTAPTETVAPMIDYQDTFMYRGNLSHTGVYLSPGPTSQPELVWQYQVPGAIFSSPAIVDGVIYFGSDNGLYTLDAQSGKELWLFETNAGITSSPAIENDIVYFGSNDGKLYAVNTSDGEEIWALKTGDRVNSSPAILNGKVYFGSQDGFFYAVDANTGKEVWKFEVAGITNPDAGVYKTVSSSPVISGNKVMFSSSQIGGASAELFFYALDLQTGQKQWEYPIWNSITSPAVWEEVVYFGGFGTFYGLDVETGTLVFEYSMGIILTAPALNDGVAYFATEDGLLVAVDLETAVEKWIYDTGDLITAAPSVADGVVYFGCNNGLFKALDLSTGKELWTYDSGERIATSPIISGGLLYFGNDAGYVFALK